MLSLKFFYLQSLASNAPVQRDALQVGVVQRPCCRRRSASSTRRRRRTTGTRCSRSSTTRAATCSGRTPTGWTRVSKKVQGLKPHAAGALGNYRFLDAWLRRDGDGSRPMTTAAEPRAVRREAPPVLALPRPPHPRRDRRAVRRLDRDLRRAEHAARQRRERRSSAATRRRPRSACSPSRCTSTGRPPPATPTGWAASSTATSATPPSASPRAQTHAPIWHQISGPLKNSAILAAITALFMIPLSLGLGVLAPVFRRQAGRPRDLDRLAGGDRAARVRDRVAAGRRLLRRRSTGCRRSRSSRRAAARSTTRPSSCCRC